MGPEDSAQLPVEGAGCIKNLTPANKLSLWEDNMGELPCVFRALPLGKETALLVSRISNWTPPGEVAENNFNAACGFWRCVCGRFFLD
jgi:hypothetical protein